MNVSDRPVLTLLCHQKKSGVSSTCEYVPPMTPVQESIILVEAHVLPRPGRVTPHVLIRSPL